MISPAQLAELYAHARAEFPRECCGYVTDVVVRCTNAWDASTRSRETAFAIDGAELVAFARTFGTASPARIVYHSHTNGRAYFSGMDRAIAVVDGAPTYPVDHVVIGIDATRITEAARFAWDGADYTEVARWQP
jgi:proteasome lid subunit RPN8/RPN11